MNKTKIKKNKDLQKDIEPFKAPLIKSRMAKDLLLKGESLREFESFKVKIISEMVPQTEIEKVLCEKFIFSAWKHRRAIIVERNILNEQNKLNDYDDENWGQNNRRIRNIKKIRLSEEDIKYVLEYQINLEKMMQKTLRRFREEQKINRNRVV